MNFIERLEEGLGEQVKNDQADEDRGRDEESKS
jgi:hypothetical protein